MYRVQLNRPVFNPPRNNIYSGPINQRVLTRRGLGMRADREWGGEVQRAFIGKNRHRMWAGCMQLNPWTTVKLFVKVSFLMYFLWISSLCLWQVLKSIIEIRSIHKSTAIVISISCKVSIFNSILEWREKNQWIIIMTYCITIRSNPIVFIWTFKWNCRYFYILTSTIRWSCCSAVHKSELLYKCTSSKSENSFCLPPPDLSVRLSTGWLAGCCWHWNSIRTQCRMWIESQDVRRILLTYKKKLAFHEDTRLLPLCNSNQCTIMWNGSIGRRAGRSDYIQSAAEEKTHYSILPPFQMNKSERETVSSSPSPFAGWRWSEALWP